MDRDVEDLIEGIANAFRTFLTESACRNERMSEAYEVHQAPSVLFEGISPKMTPEGADLVDADRAEALLLLGKALAQLPIGHNYESYRDEGERRRDKGWQIVDAAGGGHLVIDDATAKSMMRIELLAERESRFDGAAPMWYVNLSCVDGDDGSFSLELHLDEAAVAGKVAAFIRGKYDDIVAFLVRQSLEAAQSLIPEAPEPAEPADVYGDQAY